MIEYFYFFFLLVIRISLLVNKVTRPVETQREDNQIIPLVTNVQKGGKTDHDRIHVV